MLVFMLVFMRDPDINIEDEVETEDEQNLDDADTPDDSDGSDDIDDIDDLDGLSIDDFDDFDSIDERIGVGIVVVAVMDEYQDEFLRRRLLKHMAYCWHLFIEI